MRNVSQAVKKLILTNLVDTTTGRSHSGWNGPGYPIGSQVELLEIPQVDYVRGDCSTQPIAIKIELFQLLTVVKLFGHASLQSVP